MARAGASERKTGWGEGARGRGRELSVSVALSAYLSFSPWIPPSIPRSLHPKRERVRERESMDGLKE